VTDLENQIVKLLIFFLAFNLSYLVYNIELVFLKR
jgi:hypothetical protein